MNTQYLNKIKKLRSTKQFNIAVAESCTGGMLSSKLSSLSGSSEFFLGSIIAYSNKLKIKLLNVSNKTLERYGAVSHQTALSMVKGLAKKTNSDVLISITGVAGPKGGSKKTPVGCVIFGFGIKIKKKYEYFTVKRIFKKTTRRQIQINSTKFALIKIIQLINKI